jgi:geranylgeranyl pyrophosphate synthase
LLSLIAACQKQLAEVGKPGTTPETIHALSAPILERVRQLFQQAQVFDKAEKLVEKYRARAEAIADEVEPVELRELLYFLVDTILERQPPPPIEPEALPLVQLSI